MLSPKLIDALNDQMNFEFFSAHAYMAMAAYASSEDLDGFSNFFLVQAEEERFHAMKFFNFLNDMGARAVVTGFGDLTNEFDNLVVCFETGLHHEKEVTRRIYELSNIALDEREHATINFLNWFVEEQVEEEATFNNIIAKLKRIQNDMSALYTLDAEFAGRTFTPGAE